MKIVPRQKPQLPQHAVRLFLNLLIKNRLVEGENIEQFEVEFARYAGVKHAILVSSGRLALYLILKYFNISDGDEVILPSFTCPVVPSTIVSVGARPVFVDVELETFNISPSLIEQCVTKNTKIIIATHIEGRPCDLNRIIEISAKYNLKVIEDCAQALGAEYKGKKVGSIGDVAYFSFAIGKQINTKGGGVLLTNDDKIAQYIRDKVKSYRSPRRWVIIKKFIFMYMVHLSIKPFLFNLLIFPIMHLSNLFKKDIINIFFEDKGILRNFTDKYCVKYSNLQAVIGLEHLKYLERENKKRIENAHILNKYLHPSIKKQRQINNTKPIYLYYSVVLNNRSEIKRKLLKCGIDTQESWNVSCSSLELFKKYSMDCPVADELEKKVLYIPNYPNLDERVLKHIAKTINEVIKN